MRQLKRGQKLNSKALPDKPTAELAEDKMEPQKLPRQPSNPKNATSKQLKTYKDGRSVFINDGGIWSGIIKYFAAPAKPSKGLRKDIYCVDFACDPDMPETESTYLYWADEIYPTKAAAELRTEPCHPTRPEDAMEGK